MRRCVFFALLVWATVASPVVSGAIVAFFGPEASAKVSRRPLTFAERVTYQRAI